VFDVLLDRVEEKNKDIAASLVGGLALGLIWGLGGGLAVGLVGGIVFGLICGLAAGLAGSFAVGLISLFAPNAVIPAWITIASLVIITELFFCLDPKKPVEQEDRLLFTVKRKGWSLLTAALVVFPVKAMIEAYPGIEAWFAENFVLVKEAFVFFGWGITTILAVIGVFVLWVCLNSLKYKRKEE